MNLRTHWYSLVFAAALLAPAVFCWSPVIEEGNWDRYGEDVYAGLLAFQTPRAAEPSRVVTLEIDKKTVDALGWPIDRAYYVQALERLKSAGDPWILSMLSFQALSKAKLSREPLAERYATDASLANAIKAYGRVIGTGLSKQPNVELDADQEDRFMPRVTLAASGHAPEDLPRLPLTFTEDSTFVDVERAFGFGPLHGPVSVVRCLQMYITDKAQTGAFVIPSAMVWAAALADDVGIQTTAGAAWPRIGEATPLPPGHGMLKVSIDQCLTSPALSTLKYLGQRGIQRLSLVDVVQGAPLPPLAGKIVVLANAEASPYLVGPGSATQAPVSEPGAESPRSQAAGAKADSGETQEFLLVARLLDGMLTGDIIHRSRGGAAELAFMPLLVAGGLLVVSFFLPLGGVILAALGLLACVLLGSAARLAAGVYVVPTQAMASVASTTVALTALYIYLRYHAVRRQMRFAASLRSALSECNTLAEVERLALTLCQRELGACALAFFDFDRVLYDASTDASAALLLLDARSQEAPPADLDDSPATALRPAARPLGTRLVPLRARGMDADLTITSRLGRLGRVRLALTYAPHEAALVATLLSVLQAELTQHWHRIKLLVDQKLLDYRYLRELTRGEIMGRFLTKALVSKFSDARTMEENLRLVLTPRPTKAALLQADIRGYSSMSARMAPEEVVRLLQSYYRHVVDAAQVVAQVKLIGDCIFLFVEQEAAHDGKSPADIALELAALLVAETDRRNAELIREGVGTGLNFGIAIHYGDVVVGNLSSDSCIDYTVIGPNVNQVARLEELTKNQRIADVIGPNGIIVSKEAAAALMRYKQVPLADLQLEALGIAVRSFANVTTVCGMTAEAALALGRPSDAVSSRRVDRAA